MSSSGAKFLSFFNKNFIFSGEFLHSLGLEVTSGLNLFHQTHEHIPCHSPLPQVPALLAPQHSSYSSKATVEDFQRESLDEAYEKAFVGTALERSFKGVMEDNWLFCE
jgi:hypothetical protein